jgi:hypothetical protein
MNDPRQWPPLQPWDYPQSVPQLPRGQVPSPVLGGQSLPGSGAGARPVRDPHHYATLSGSARLPVDTASVLILAAPPTYRNMLLVRNTGATNVFIEFGTDADATRTPIRLAPNSILIFDSVVPQDDVFAVGDAAGGFVGISYSNVNYTGAPTGV